jgi:hypothetical protein
MAFPTAYPGAFILYGTVYDLQTLKPVPNAQLSFTKGSVVANIAVADPYGRYAAVLGRPDSYRPEDGYDISTQTPGYAQPVLHETDIPYAKLSASDRLEMIRLARSSDVHSSPLFDIEGQARRELDVFIAPLKKSEP